MKTAFFGSQQLKDKVIRMLQEDRKADRIIQGEYWNDYKGCHLGCLTRASRGAHGAAERLFGIPARVGYWFEAVFEGLPANQCENWVVESTAAIPAGADLSKVHHELAYWLLSSDSPSAVGNSHVAVADAVARVRELHAQTLNGQAVLRESWSAARSAAWSAAWSAAESAARSAAWSAESAARSAAWFAARSAARSAESAAWGSIAEKSIEIFRASPTIECDGCEKDVAAAFAHLDRIAVTI